MGETQIYIIDLHHHRLKDIADRRMDTSLKLFCKTVNHEGTLIIAEEGTGNRQAHNIVMHILSSIDDNKYYFYLRTIAKWNKLPGTTINTPGVLAPYHGINARIHSIHPVNFQLQSCFPIKIQFAS